MGKNVYLLFGWEETYYVHELAKSLLELDAVDGVGGIVNHQRYHDFLREQDEIKYDVLHCIPEVHRELSERQLSEQRLKHIEEAYGSHSLWRFVLADRDYVNYDHKRAKQMIQQWFDFYLNVFDEFHPDIYLAYGVAAAYTWIPYHLTHELGGTAISWKSLRVGGRYGLMVNNPHDSFPRIWKRFDAFKTGTESREDYIDASVAAEEFLSEFREDGTRPSYFSTSSDNQSIISKLTSAGEKPFKLLRYSLLYHINTDLFGPNYVYNDFRKDPPLERVENHLRTAYRGLRMDYGNLFEEPQADEQFTIFPLHLQPEASTMLLAPMYLDQPAIVRQISRSLPLNYKLYVKEHPNMVGRRPLSYYERFSDLPNVKLIHPNADSHKLVKQSDLVTTITGTMGLEALFFQTPVLTLGNPHYSRMEMVFEGGDPDSLAGEIRTALTEYEHDEEELRQYLTAIFAEGFDIPGGDFASSADGATDRAEALFSELKPYIEGQKEAPVTRE